VAAVLGNFSLFVGRRLRHAARRRREIAGYLMHERQAVGATSTGSIDLQRQPVVDQASYSTSIVS
jgi:hypothetical protein